MKKLVFRLLGINITSLSTLFVFALFALPVLTYASTIYNFSSDTLGSQPANTTVTGGAFAVASSTTFSNALRATSKTGEVAGIIFDSFASTTDYSVTWKEEYSSATGHDGFILRAQSTGTNLASHESARLGYLFQVYETNSVYIWSVTSSGFTSLYSGSLAKAGPRYYKATVVGNQQGFDYSNDGTTWTHIATTTDSTYTSGLTQYTAGYGAAVGTDYVDDITYTSLVPTPLTLVGTSSLSTRPSTALPITDLQIEGNATTSTPVKLLVSNGSLSMSTTTGLTFTGSQTGSTLYFSGSITNINNALASLVYTPTSVGTDTLEVSLVNSGEVFFPDNGHIYKFITSTGTWNNALAAAPNQTAYGVSGYLATITSSAENAFISERLTADGWIGASDSITEGDWKWKAGPESGVSFWTSSGGGHAVGEYYANWNSGEPNDSGSNEDCAQYYSGSGRWNDLPCSGVNLTGYVAEFGTSNSLPTVAAKNVTIVTAADVTPPVITNISTSTASTTSTITWTTDELASSIVSYGPTSSYSTSTHVVDISPFVLSHTVALSNLIACSSYHFAVVSSDDSSNTATSSDQTFMTTGCAGSSTPSQVTTSSINVSSSATTTLAQASSTFGVITPNNFTSTSSSVVIQIHALAATTTLDTLGVPPNSQTPYNGVGSTVFDVKAFINETTLLDSFDAPVTITYTYSDEDIVGLDESTLWLYHYHDSVWSRLDTCFVDTAANSITCTTPSFSVFALFGQGPGGLPSFQISTQTYGCADPKAINYQSNVLNNQAICLYDSSNQNQVLSQGQSSTVTQTIAFASNASSTVSTTGSMAETYIFPRDLKKGMTGDDVKALQVYLNMHGNVLTQTGPGSVGNETNLFGSLTQKAVINFQKAHNITPAIGYFGPITRGVVAGLK
ncbi:MAG: peptidoglycan-binding protein [Candidatus Pacebacteria bacterium]|nr:peptidoglycan-binding protein [Candidatus Paceibacterota bacterium]